MRALRLQWSRAFNLVCEVALNVNNPMKVCNNYYKLNNYITTMLICGTYMFEFSVSKDMKSMLHKKRGGSMEDSGTFISNDNFQGSEN